MYSYNLPKLDKWKYTNLETTVFYKALCVTPVPEIVVNITWFSGKNSSNFFLRIYLTLTYTDSCTVGTWLRRSLKSSSVLRVSRYLDEWPLSQHSFVAISEREAVFSETTLVSAFKYVNSVHASINLKECRTDCTGTGFPQFPRALGECGTV